MIIYKSQKRSSFSHLVILIGGAILFIDLIVAKIIGALIIALGVFILYAKTGIAIDKSARKYREFISIASLVFGKWVQLPEVDYVAVVRVRLSQLKFRPSEITFKQVEGGFDFAYNVNLIFKNSPKRFLKIYTSDANDGLKIGMELAKDFNTQLYDCTTSNKKWIESSQA